MTNRKTILDTAALDRALSNHQRRAEAIKQIIKILGEFPDLLSELNQDSVGNLFEQPSTIKRIRLREPSPSVVTKILEAPKNGLRQTNYEKVRKFFLGNGNAWASAPDVARAIGIQRGPVGHILWIDHPDAFDRQKVSKRNVQWRLKTVA